ncbi:MAG TPA: DUF4097 family beta strand repeat-containing protein, partial [Myxococcales bacterium]|nr:DUF4097 family beta strand repeat-containing protein [Myxococcales bacterium]
MIGSIALLSALLAAPPGDRPRAGPPRGSDLDVRGGDLHLHLDLRDLEIPDLRFEFPDLEALDIDLSNLRLDQVKALRELRNLDLLAQRDEDDDDEDRDEAQDRIDRERDRIERERERQLDRIERERERERQRWNRERTRWMSRFGSDDDEGEGKPSARATGKKGAATLAVKGPVTFRLRVQSGEVEVVGSDKPQIALSVGGVPIAGDVQLLQFGDRVEAEFNGRRHLNRGKLRVELPKGSSLEFDSASGDLSVQQIGGDVRVRTMSGDVKVQGARNADLESISGDVTVSATGPKQRLHLVSGTAVVTTVDPAVQLAFQSASGNLEWTGVCAKGCHLTTETVSGDIKLLPDASRSSFQLSYASHSGGLRDELKLEMKRRPKKDRGWGGWVEA